MEKKIIFDKDGFLLELNQLKKETSAKVKTKLKAALKDEVQEKLRELAPNIEGETVAAWKKFKKEITIIPSGSKDDLPKEVYEAVMQGVAAKNEAIRAKIELGAIDGETIKNISSWFYGIYSTSKTTVTGKSGTIYTVTMSAPYSATIKTTNETYTLSGWDNGSAATKAVNSFIEDLQNYIEDYRINIWRELLKDAVGALLDNFIDKLGSLHGGAAKDIFDELKKYIELESESSDVVGGAIDNIFELIPVTKELIEDIEKNYKTFLDKFGKLTTYAENVSTDTDSILTANQYTAFATACHNLEVYSIDYLAERYLSYEFTDVTGGEFDENHVLINGTDDNNTIKANGSSVTINTFGGNDNIRTEKHFATISGGEGDDSIDARGYWNKISGGVGDDEIRNEGDGSEIDSGESDDIISNYGDDSTVEGGAGDDDILVDAYDNSISGGDGDDRIIVLGKRNTINGGAGDDKIYLVEDIEDGIIEYKSGDGNDIIFGYDENIKLNIAGNYVTSTSGQNVIIAVGDDSITLVGASGKRINVNDTSKVIGEINFGATTTYTLPGSWGNTLNFNRVKYGTNDDDKNWYYIAGDYYAYNDTSRIMINMLAGNDTINNNGNYVMINGGAGDDDIDNDGDNSSLFGDEGNDYIYNNGTSVKVDGGDGEDNISNSGDNVTIKGGTGDDYISAIGKNVWNSKKGAYETVTGNYVSVDGEDGNDFISNSYKKTTYGYDNYGGDNFIGRGGAGDDDIDNSGDNSSLFGNEGNDYIYNSGTSVKVDGGDGADTISNWSDSVKIDGGDGKDNINNHGGSEVSINGGDDNDTISNEGDSVTIDGGAGNDDIINEGSDVTIDSGKGNDDISLSSDHRNNLILFRKGEGHDLVEGFNTSDTLSIVGGGYVTTSGNDIIIQSGGGSITLADARLSTLNIIFSNGSDTSGAFYVDDTDENGHIHNYLAGSTIKVPDEESSISNYAAKVSILGSDGDDDIVNEGDYTWNYETNKWDYTTPDSVTIDGGDGNDSISNEGDSVKIDGGDGNDDIINSGWYGGDNVTINGGDDDDNISNEGDSVKIDGGDGNDDIINKGSDVTIDGGADNDIVRNYNNKITIDGNADDDTIYNSSLGTNVSINGGTGNDSILNGFYYNYSSNKNVYSGIGASSVTIDGGDGNDTIQSGGNLALIRGDNGNDSIRNDGKNSTLVGGAGNDSITNGDWRGGGGSNVVILCNDGSDYIFNSSLGSNASIDGGDGNDTIQSNGNLALIRGDDGNDSIRNNGKKSTLVGGAGNDSISNSGDSVSIFAGAGDDSIYNSGDNVSINASDGSNTINNNFDGDSVTIIGGEDNDSIYNGGDSVMVDAGDGSNTINNYSGDSVTIISGASNDSIYSSNGNNVTIESGTGNDTIYNNSSSYLSINGGAGNDSIKNYHGDNILICGGDGNDTVHNDNYSSYVSINTGGGDDSIYNNGENASIDGGKGDDTISNDNYNKKMLIHGGDDNDSIFNRADNTTIYGDNGNDYLENFYANNVTIDGGSGDDTLCNNNEKTTIYGGTGDDSVYNEADSVMTYLGDGNDIYQIKYNRFYNTVDGGDGNDSIVGTISFVYGGAGNDTINGGYVVNGGKGDDVIYSGGGRLFTYSFGDGNDTVYNFYASDTLSVIGGSYSMETSGSDIIVKVGEGSITLKDAKDKLLNIDGTHETKIFTGTENADAIKSTLVGATIQALGGNDKIENLGANSLILSGDGNDSIANDNVASESQYNKATQKYEWTRSFTPKKVTISSGNGHDYISNGGKNVSINAGSGNDTIYNRFKSQYLYNYETGKWEYAETINPDNVTIYGGIGEDYIANSGSNVKVSSGEGNDSIYNSGLMSKIEAGGNDDYISNSGDFVTIDGGKGNDDISNSGSSVTFYYSGGNDSIRGFNSNSTLKILASNVEYASSDGKNILLSIGKDTLKLVSVSNLETLSVLDKNGNPISFDIKREIVGTKSNDTIHNKCDNIFISSDDGEDDISNTYSNVTINTGSGNDIVNNWEGTNISINGSTGNDSLHNEGTYTTILGGAGNDFIYNAGASSVIDAGTGNDTIGNYDVQRGTYDEDSGNFKATETITPDNTTISGGEGNDYIYNSGSNIVFQYNAGDGSDTISGFDETSTLKIINGVYSTQTNNKDIIVTIGNGKITLVGATKLTSVNIDGEEEITWKLNGTTATYGNLITVKGVKSLDGISLSSKVVTVSKASVNAKDITISDGYTLKLSGVNPSSLIPAHFDDLTYKSASRSEGYSLSSDKKSISYTPAVAKTDLFSLSNVKNTDSIAVDTKKKTVTLKADNLNKKAVTISNGFTLKLANDIPTSTTKTVGAFTKFKSGTATFKTTSYSDFYSLKNNQVTYTAASGGKAISIKNLKSSATLDEIKSAISVAELKNGTFKISFKNADVLTTKAPTISASGITYSVALNKALKPASLAPDWKVSGTNASLKSDTSAGYTVSDNKVFYSKKVTGSPQLVLGGLIKNSSLSAPVKKVVTLDSKILGSNASLKSNAGSYTVKLTGNMSKKTFTGSANADTLNIAANNAAVLGGAGNDSFTVTGSKVTLTGGKGNDSFKLSGKNPMLIYNTGDGNDTINFVAGMQISLSGSTQIKTLGKSGSDLLLGFGKNSSVKVTGAKSTDTLKASDVNGSVTLVAGKFDLANSLTFNSKNSSVTVDKNFMGSLAPSDDIYLGGSKLSKVATINAANVTGEFTLTGNDKANIISAGKNNDEIFGGNGNDSLVGNAGNDKLYGQNGNDSLSGGKGNDTLTGGDGKDVFIYSAGNDVIADFTAGQDKIQIAGGKISKTSLSGSDVLFTIGKGSLTVKNAKGKTINLLDSSNKASYTVVGAQALTNSNKTSVSIGADMGAVDASARTKAIKITGNALANTISGGTKNDSIFGAAGNDYILGNAGNDKLYGDAGNDIIYGGNGNDSLWGGAGNDSLWGDVGKDTFIYTANEGTDKIFDFETGDMLKILNADGSDGSFKSSKYSGGDLTLTINGGGKIIFDDVASTTKFNINGLSYNISGSKLVKK